MAYTNSPLISATKLSPNYTGGRDCINRITIHHTASDAISCERIGEIFANPGRGASCNYGIGNDGRICLIVEEKNRAWTSSNGTNDRKAITYEVSNSKYGEPWPISDAAYESVIALSVDICRRNGISEVFNIQKEIAAIPQSQRAAFANNYAVPAGKCLLTEHNYFAATACPGTTIKGHLQEITNEINRRLSGQIPTPTPPAPIPTPAADLVAAPTLLPGSTGAEVKKLQKNLNTFGYRLDVDGAYGKDTTAAVKGFQTLTKIGADGKYGPQTAAKMREYIK